MNTSHAGLDPAFIDRQRQRLTETEGVLLARALERLVRVDRALKKIADGTHGLSDLSAQPIPRELESRAR